MGFGGGGSQKAAKSAAKAEKNRQAQITAGTQKVNDIFSQFTPDYYATRATDYNNWAMPQVEDQYKKAQEQLKFALARQYGSTNTSEAAKRQAQLGEDYGLAKTNQTEQGLALSNRAKAEMENSRSQVLQELSASADPGSAASSALAQSDLATHVDPYTPLGELFANVTEGLASSQYPYGLLNQPSGKSYSGVGTTPKSYSYVK